MSTSHRGPTALAREAAERVLAVNAAAVDRAACFPEESIDALREAGLLAYMAPARMGRGGGTVSGFAEIAELLGGGCLSTALIWVMHGQQTAILAAHGGVAHEAALADVAENGSLVASVTSEVGAGDLTHVEAALEESEGMLRVRRRAPTVSYGGEAQHYLVTMRRDPAAPSDQVRLVRVHRGDGEICVHGKWDALGMRGTQSMGMSFDVCVSRDRIVGTDFRRIANETLIPLGHVGWSAAWLGATRAGLKAVVLLFRRKGNSAVRGISSDLVRNQIARLRMNVDLVGALLSHCVRIVERSAGRSSATDQIAINNLKVAASELLYSTAEGLVYLAGMASGYLQERDPPLERLLRDLRSASLMVHNDGILAANARLILTESSPVFSSFGAALDGLGAPEEEARRRPGAEPASRP